jgi:hypothetical protein
VQFVENEPSQAHSGILSMHRRLSDLLLIQYAAICYRILKHENVEVKTVLSPDDHSFNAPVVDASILGRI